MSSHSTHSSSTASLARNRQYTHLQSQLAQLNAHLADTENLLAMTAVQAEYLRGLGGWWGGLFMSASKVLGEEGNNSAATAGAAGGGDRTKAGRE
ncbi:MAG: hypothetical protein L6R35_000393 [Caloplaca aegaea]|nr:MAG: hypothetical protein L6R35_000393 [Caloplaca aegaea]